MTRDTSHTTDYVTPETELAYQRLYDHNDAADVDAVRHHEWKKAYQAGLATAAEVVDLMANKHQSLYDHNRTNPAPYGYEEAWAAERDQYREQARQLRLLAKDIRALKDPTPQPEAKTGEKP